MEDQSGSASENRPTSNNQGGKRKRAVTWSFNASTNRRSKKTNSTIDAPNLPSSLAPSSESQRMQKEASLMALSNDINGSASSSLRCSMDLLWKAPPSFVKKPVDIDLDHIPSEPDNVLASVDDQRSMHACDNIQNTMDSSHTNDMPVNLSSWDFSDGQVHSNEDFSNTNRDASNSSGDNTTNAHRDMSNAKPNHLASTSCTLCLVIESIETKSAKTRQLVLLCTVVSTGAFHGQKVDVVLCDLWIDCAYVSGATITITNAIVQQTSSNPTIHLSGSKENQSLLVFEPSLLISITTVADSMVCPRKGLLSLIAQPLNLDSSTNLALVKGTISHDVFEQVIGSSDPLSSLHQLPKLIQESISSNLFAVHAAGVKSEQEVTDAVNQVLEKFPLWCRRFLRSVPSSDAIIIDEPANSIKSKNSIAIPKVFALEAMYTSHILGLKGKMDAVVLMRFTDPVDDRTCSLVVPLELKTGNNTRSSEHRAQTLLYTLLISEHLQVPVNTGLLFYVSKDELVRISASFQDISALIMVRNRIACAQKRYVHSITNVSCDMEDLMKIDLPPVLSNKHICNMCSHQANCSILESIRNSTITCNDNTATTTTSDDDLLLDDIPDDLDFEEEEKVGEQLSISDQKLSKEFDSKGKFIRHWLGLIQMEENQSMIDRRLSRQEMLRNSQSVHLLSIIKKDESNIGSAFPFCCRFSLTPYLADLLIGDPIVVSQQFSSSSMSTEEAIRDVALGFVTAVHVEDHHQSIGYLQVMCDRDISVVYLPDTQSFDSKSEQNFVQFSGQSSPAVLGRSTDLLSHSTSASCSKKLFAPTTSIDTLPCSPCSLPSPPSVQMNSSSEFYLRKDEMMAGFSLLRSNILQLIMPRHQRLFDLTVRKCPPRMSSPDANLQHMDPKIYQQSLDPQQIMAIEKCLQAKDYALLLGMPGTGKSTTLVGLIRALVLGLNARVLITSYTNSAVDNLMSKIESAGFAAGRLLRLGSASRIRSDVADSMMLDCSHGLSALRNQISSAQIVGVTCLAVNSHFSAAYSNELFDYCIVDEASQCTFPAIIGSLFAARKFILCGDHYQLPPLVRSSEAQEAGLALSLFKSLAESHPQAVAVLSTQYRMNEEIQRIPNHTIYNHQLSCASDFVAQQKLDISPSPCLFCSSSSSINGSVSNDSGDNGNAAMGTSDAPTLSGINSMLSLSKTVHCWLDQTLNPVNRVLFLNTDAICTANESLVGRSFCNVIEAMITTRIVDSLIQCGLAPIDIGIIAPYKPQVAAISNVISSKDVEVSTVDRFQGRDKRCILLSMTRSNAAGALGSILCDWHRLNVAFTRAKDKLIVIGSYSTVMTHPEFKTLSQLFLDRQWVLHLSSNALEHRITL